MSNEPIRVAACGRCRRCTSVQDLEQCFVCGKHVCEHCGDIPDGLKNALTAPCICVICKDEQKAVPA